MLLTVGFRTTAEVSGFGKFSVIIFLKFTYTPKQTWFPEYFSPRTLQPLPFPHSSPPKNQIIRSFQKLWSKSCNMACKGHHQQQAKVFQEVINAPTHTSQFIPYPSQASQGLLDWSPLTTFLLQRKVFLYLPLHHLAKYHRQTKLSSVLWSTALGQVKKTLISDYCTVLTAGRDKLSLFSPHIYRESVYWNQVQVPSLTSACLQSGKYT